jgi:hypothetical protein
MMVIFTSQTSEHLQNEREEEEGEDQEKEKKVSDQVFFFQVTCMSPCLDDFHDIIF